MKELGNQKGFSLIELLLVVVIIGIVAAMAVPAYQRGVRAAENGSAFAAMRSMSSAQVAFFSQNNRFGTLPELQQMQSNRFGTTTGDRIVRGRYIFEMTPTAPTPGELATEYTISAIRTAPGEVTYRYELTQSGRIVQIQPGPSFDQ